MSRLLIRGIHTLVTAAGDDSLHDVDLSIVDGKVEAIGADLEIGDGTRVIDGSWRVVYPGFINTHHHLYQTLTRNVPEVHCAELFDWLRTLYEVWRGLAAEAVEVSTEVGIAELLLSGCTTTSDHLYLFPAGAPEELLDVEIETARRMGMRFHPARGSMNLGRSQGGLPPDDLVQSADVILRDCERVIDKYHDPSPFSMCRVVLAPCSPFSVTTELLEQTAILGRERGLRLHTHLAESKDENEFCLATHDRRPLDYMIGTGWVGEDVWFAHGIYFEDEEIRQLASTGTGIAHCPASNLRLGSGVCKVPRLLEAGVNVGLAVDGSASNDASSMVREMQLALLLHRVTTAVDALPPAQVLSLATVGSAKLLGRPELGRLTVGAAGDAAIFRLDRVDFAGAMRDPASAILYCGSAVRADCTIVAGEVLVENGHLVGIDEQRLFHRANEIAAGLTR